MSAEDFVPLSLDVPTPTLSALWGYMHNKDFWRNEDIWKGDPNVSPKFERYNETPQAWVSFGEKTGLSPVRSQRAFEKVVPVNAYTMGGIVKDAGLSAEEFKKLL